MSEKRIKRLASIEDLSRTREEIRAARNPDQPLVILCGGTGCRSAGSLALADAFEKELASKGLSGRVALKISGCHGLCQEGPVVVVEPSGIFYRRVGIRKPERDVREIVEQTVAEGKPVERLLVKDRERKPVPKYDDIPFYAKQTRIVLRNNGKIDPRSVEDYIAADGYAALARALEGGPEDILSCIDKSGLRGRGGAGFPTARKWRFCRDAKDRSMRYIICNADEGDPGAFMDRSIVEGDPHAVLEGMAIGAYAISRGVAPAEGLVYIRAEYPLAVETLKTAIAEAEAAGLLGDGILGTDFNFHVKIKQGAGAFVCGEETALMASVEGRRGEPRVRPPFPAQSGLWGKPTNINNVETWANVPRIVLRGADWYAGIGTGTSKGTKVFSLVGKIKNSGLIEVPMGVTLREIVEEIGGGVPDGKAFKAIQTGGPSGGCIPADQLDLPVDYEHLTQAGSIMGSGGMVVMDEDSCMVDVARYFIAFTESESCGKCVPCRMGTQHLLRILTDITEGRGAPDALDQLKRICDTMKKGSLCGLGQTAPNPVLTTIRYFENEYRAHIDEKRCPAGVCRELIEFSIDAKACTGCRACARACPVQAISGEKKAPHQIDQKTCVRCGVCRETCNHGAVMVK